MTETDDSLKDHAARIERVVRHIAANPDGDLSLDALSEVACLSRFHFHRIYRGWVGETVAETVRRLRMHQATSGLLDGLDALTLAKIAGYSSPTSFSRAFARSYGVPPTAYRALSIATAIKEGAIAVTDLDVNIMNGEAMTCIGYEHRGAYMRIGETFERLGVWLGAHGGSLGEDARMIGIYFDDPETVPESDLRSVAAVTVPADFATPEGMERVDLPATRYAVCLHKGSYAELPQVYNWLYSTWLPQSGETPADLPGLEEYLNDPRKAHPTELLTDIMIPLEG